SAHRGVEDTVCENTPACFDVGSDGASACVEAEWMAPACAAMREEWRDGQHVRCFYAGAVAFCVVAW
ncbi:MAG TPA: hypothetical protein VM582_05795, partial [Candidatus Thermoplasmatota archaeon]|nr:hypothetical protein [Candidatus Thermoplasmatota archaeon]